MSSSSSSSSSSAEEEEDYFSEGSEDGDILAPEPTSSGPVSDADARSATNADSQPRVPTAANNKPESEMRQTQPKQPSHMPNKAAAATLLDALKPIIEPTKFDTAKLQEYLRSYDANVQANSVKRLSCVDLAGTRHYFDSHPATLVEHLPDFPGPKGYFVHSGTALHPGKRLDAYNITDTLSFAPATPVGRVNVVTKWKKDRKWVKCAYLGPELIKVTNCSTLASLPRHNCVFSKNGRPFPKERNTLWLSDCGVKDGDNLSARLLPLQFGVSIKVKGEQPKFMEISSNSKISDVGNTYKLYFNGKTLNPDAFFQDYGIVDHDVLVGELCPTIAARATARQLHRLNNRAEAVAMSTKLLSNIQDEFGSDHPETLSAINEVQKFDSIHNEGTDTAIRITVLSTSDRHKEIEIELMELLRKQKDEYGLCSTVVAETMVQLADICGKQGRFDDAIYMYDGIIHGCITDISTQTKAKERIRKYTKAQKVKLEVARAVQAYKADDPITPADRYIQLIMVLTETVGSCNPGTLEAAASAIKYLCVQERPTDAYSVHKKVLHTLQTSIPVAHPYTRAFEADCSKMQFGLYTQYPEPDIADITGEATRLLNEAKEKLAKTQQKAKKRLDKANKSLPTASSDSFNEDDALLQEFETYALSNTSTPHTLENETIRCDLRLDKANVVSKSIWLHYLTSE